MNLATGSCTRLDTQNREPAHRRPKPRQSISTPLAAGLQLLCLRADAQETLRLAAQEVARPGLSRTGRAAIACPSNASTSTALGRPFPARPGRSVCPSVQGNCTHRQYRRQSGTPARANDPARARVTVRNRRPAHPPSWQRQTAIRFSRHDIRPRTRRRNTPCPARPLAEGLVFTIHLH
jgi:hypothetical protein